MENKERPDSPKKRWGFLLFWREAGGESELSQHLLAARTIILSMLTAVGIGLGAIIADTGRQWHRGTLVAIACLAAGFLVGFLFGIPKVIQGEKKLSPEETLAYRQKVNTNLEEVSDWLTKIIVGLGLFELKQVPNMIWELSGRLSTSFVEPEKQRAVICAAIIFFSVCGFLLGYLVTRLYVQAAFWKADAGVRPDDQEPKKQQDSQVQDAENAADLGLKAGNPDDGADNANE